MTPNKVAVLVLIAFCIGYGYLNSQQSETAMLGEPGSKLLPWILTVFLFFLAGVVFYNDVKGKALPKRFSFKITPGGIRAVTGLIFILVYSYVIFHLGFIISSFLFFASIMLLCGEKRPLRILGFSCGIPFFLFFFFQKLFQIPLPMGWGLWGIF